MLVCTFADTEIWNSVCFFPKEIKVPFESILQFLIVFVNKLENCSFNTNEHFKRWLKISWTYFVLITLKYFMPTKCTICKKWWTSFWLKANDEKLSFRLENELNKKWHCSNGASEKCPKNVRNKNVRNRNTSNQNE
jgi:hypothetical protein